MDLASVRLALPEISFGSVMVGIQQPSNGKAWRIRDVDTAYHRARVGANRSDQGVMRMVQIDYFLATVSPYVYLAGNRLEQIAARHGATIRYLPLKYKRFGKKCMPVTGWLK